MKVSWLGALLCLLAAAASAQAPTAPPAAAWSRAGHVMLELADAAADVRARWQFDRADNGDHRILREEQRAGAQLAGAVLVVCDTYALLLRGLEPARGRELAELDGPLVHLQLVLRLLARAAPAGPAAVSAAREFELAEAATPIRAGRGARARRDFNAPWQARGRLAPAAGGGVDFEIAFEHAGEEAAAPRVALRLAGLWREDSAVRRFDDATDLGGWRVFRLDPVVISSGGNDRIERVALPRPAGYATLGLLRRDIERAWSPNPKVKPVMECKS